MSERSHRQLLGGMRDLALVKLRKAHQVMTDNAGMSEGMRAHLRAEYEGVRGYVDALNDAINKIDGVDGGGQRDAERREIERQVLALGDTPEQRVEAAHLALGDAVLACLDECPRDVQDAVKVWRAASEALARAA